MHSTPQPDIRADAIDRLWLRRLCYATILATFSLITIGGKVTSYEFGMAIEGGWTTGGVVSFLARPEYWFYDTDKFWEHTHRIVGSFVGCLTFGMMVWLWRTQRDRPWLKWMGVAMLAMVGFQGYLGATRVNENSLAVAFMHGIGGQLILCGWIVIVAALSRPWLSRLKAIAQRERLNHAPRLRRTAVLLLVLLLGQLTLGSAVRHFKADKAIPDFPLIYGHVLPPMYQESLDDRYVAYYTQEAEQMGQAVEEGAIVNRYSETANDPELAGKPIVTVESVHLQWWHRLGAVIVCTVGGIVIVRCLRQRPSGKRIVLAPALVLLTMLAMQFALGVITVLTGTDPLIATMHQATGAALIAVATWLTVRIHLSEYSPADSVAPTVHTDTAHGPRKPSREQRPAPVTA